VVPTSCFAVDPMEADGSTMQRYRDSLHHALESGDKDHVRRVVFDLGNEQMASGEFDEELFAVVLELLEDDEFLSNELNWHVLRIFDHGWDDLSEKQRARLLVAIARSFPKIVYWMGRFALADFVGQYYCTQDGLKAFERVIGAANPEVRFTTTPGLAQIAKRAVQKVHREHAIAVLRRLSHDDDAEVRKGAIYELAVLHKAGDV
jgi:hypothetical protein